MSAPRAPVLVTGASGFVGLALVEHLLARGDAVVGLDGISKLAAEQAALRLAALHDLDLVVGRLGPCFGPWEADSGVRDTPSAPLQVLRLAERGEEAMLPRPHPRDWLYVRDAAAGLAALLDAPRPAHRTVNVAAGFVRPLADWCRAIAPAFPGWRWRIARTPPTSPSTRPMTGRRWTPRGCAPTRPSCRASTSPRRRPTSFPGVAATAPRRA